MKRAALLISLLAVAVVWLTAVPVLASPQPSPVCGACGSSFEDVAEDHGTTASVTASTASIQINPNGSATWVVTNRLNQSPADFSNNPELLTRISREAATNRGVANRDGTEATFQSATLENRTVHIRFRDPDAGSRHLGVLVVDYFHSAGVRGGWILNADPISVSGPDGTVVLNDPRAVINDEHASDDELPTVTGHTVEWMNTSTDGQRAIFADDVYLAFGSSETSSLQREAALTVASLPIWLDNLWSYVVPAVFGYGILLTGVAVGARRAADTEFSVDRLAAVVAGSGGAFLGLAAFGVLPATLVGVGAIYVIVGGITWYRPELLRSTRGTLAVGLASLGGVATTVWGGWLLQCSSCVARTDVCPRHDDPSTAGSCPRLRPCSPSAWSDGCDRRDRGGVRWCVCRVAAGWWGVRPLRCPTVRPDNRFHARWCGSCRTPRSAAGYVGSLSADTSNPI